MATIPIRMSPTPSSTVPSKPKLSSTTRFLSSSNSSLPNRRTTLLLAFSFSSKNGPETECPVPQEQQPINEYHSLSTSFPFSWAAGDAVEYGSRLFVTGASFALLVGLPVAWFGSAGAQSEPLKRVLCGASSGVFAVTLAVVRMYLGWAYVGNRLLSATVEYEETGWYDGQIWVKTAEVLARDRLLGSFSVKPLLSRLKITLVSLATSLLVCALILINMEGDQNLTLKEPGIRVVPGVYNDDSARLYEPDAFCGGGRNLGTT
ncbi:uncharacterized protein ycf36 isoform X1 [Abrus precatorius]|uniref:Uncharacterized protein ycf36 isoform X1 n=1 Tax=Abrus precatorius TaxID=3816 RepID=A0A8B8JKS0_ABRPR|nr:uncharacterized protein ycf36 isoform X1 [Abrus precatorius]